MGINRPQDPHDQTLRPTRVRKVPDSASAAVAATAMLETTNQLAANTAMIRKWVNQHKVATAIPATTPIGPKRQSA